MSMRKVWSCPSWLRHYGVSACLHGNNENRKIAICPIGQNVINQAVNRLFTMFHCITGILFWHLQKKGKYKFNGKELSIERFFFDYGLSDWVNWMENRWKLTYIHDFSVIILWKINLRNVIPLFHLQDIITLSISTLNRVELVVELGWNYMKFHPNSTHNSTILIFLIIKTIATPRWKGGITFRKIIFLEITAENMWNYVKKLHFWGKSALWICVHNGIDIAR